MRNRICHFLANNETTPTRLTSHEHPIRGTWPISSSNWALLQQQSLGLTQTCQQLRNEFLPVLRAKTTHIVALYDLPTYVKVYLRGTFGNDPNVVGKLIVDLNPPTPYTREEPRVSIKSLIEVYTAANPNFTVQFRDTHRIRSTLHGVPDLQQLVSFARGSTWESYARDCVQLISIRIWNGVCLRVDMRKGCDHNLVRIHGNTHYPPLKEQYGWQWEQRAGLNMPGLRKYVTLYSMGP